MVLECSGGGARRDLALSCAGLDAEVALIGQGGHLLADVTSMINLKRLSIYGIWHYNLTGYDSLIEIIANNADKIDMMITHVFSLESALQAWQIQMTGKCGKMIIDPWME
jgi:L-iditol 2-dehydrogenase